MPELSFLAQPDLLERHTELAAVAGLIIPRPRAAAGDRGAARHRQERPDGGGQGDGSEAGMQVLAGRGSMSARSLTG